jgi:hypothetical protein
MSICQMSCQLFCCRALVTMAYNEDSCAILAGTKAGRLVSKVLAQAGDNLELKQQACRAISNFASFR